MTNLMRTRRLVMMFLACCLVTISANDITRGQEPGSNVRDRARLFDPLIVRTATRYTVDARLLWTVAYLETRFRPGLISPKGARGMMQFMPATAARYQLTNPHDPAQSIDAAARYLRDLQGRFGNRLDLVLAAYNAGEGAVEAYRDGKTLFLKTGKIINSGGIMTGGVPPYRETRNYVASGVNIYRSLKGPPLAKYASSMPNTEAEEESGEKLRAIREDSLYVVPAPYPTTNSAKSEKNKDSIHLN